MLLHNQVFVNKRQHPWLPFQLCLRLPCLPLINLRLLLLLQLLTLTLSLQALLLPLLLQLRLLLAADAPRWVLQQHQHMRPERELAAARQQQRRGHPLLHQKLPPGVPAWDGLQACQQGRQGGERVDCLIGGKRVAGERAAVQSARHAEGGTNSD